MFDKSGLFQSEWVFGLDAGEFADRKSAARVALHVFDVCAGACTGLFQRLHRAMAVLAAHRLTTLGESLVEGARQPTTAYFDLTLCHHRRPLPRSHRRVRCSCALSRLAPGPDEALRNKSLHPDIARQ
jgi:hypothetical protein